VIDTKLRPGKAALSSRKRTRIGNIGIVQMVTVMTGQLLVPEESVYRTNLVQMCATLITITLDSGIGLTK
jgi:hypothetical protein